MNECVIEWIKGQATASVTFAPNTKYANKLQKLAKEYPDVVDIIVNPDGSVFGHVPLKWVRLSPSRKLTEEQRIAAVEALKKYKEKEVDK